MFSCNRHETTLIMQDRFGGAVRRYDPKMGCPHIPGSKIVITSRFTKESPGQDMPIADAQVVSVRPGTVGEFRKSDTIAKIDGFPNATAWHTYFSRQMYEGIKDTEPVFHIQMRVSKIEKNPKKRTDPEDNG